MCLELTANPDSSNVSACTTAPVVSSEAINVLTTSNEKVAPTAATTMPAATPNDSLLKSSSSVMSAAKKRQFMDEARTLLPHDYTPGDFDVLCGRGAICWKHPGNVRYKALIKANALKYNTAPKKIDKSVVVASVIKKLRRNGTLFLKRDADTNHWYDIGNNVARDKAGHAIRDCLKKLLQRQRRLAEAKDSKARGVKASAATSVDKARAAVNGGASMCKIKDGTHTEHQASTPTRLGSGDMVCMSLCSDQQGLTCHPPHGPLAPSTQEMQIARSRLPVVSHDLAPTASSTKDLDRTFASLASRISSSCEFSSADPLEYGSCCSEWNMDDLIPIVSTVAPTGSYVGTIAVISDDGSVSVSASADVSVGANTVADACTFVMEQPAEARCGHSPTRMNKGGLHGSFRGSAHVRDAPSAATRLMPRGASLLHHVSEDRFITLDDEVEKVLDAPKKVSLPRPPSAVFRLPALPDERATKWVHGWMMGENPAESSFASLDVTDSGMSSDRAPESAPPSAAEAETVAAFAAVRRQQPVSTLFDFMPFHELHEGDFDFSTSPFNDAI